MKNQYFDFQALWKIEKSIKKKNSTALPEETYEVIKSIRFFNFSWSSHELCGSPHINFFFGTSAKIRCHRLIFQYFLMKLSQNIL